jgi:hypothetical protein
LGRHFREEPAPTARLGAALGRLLRDPRIIAAALVDYDSGMALETYGSNSCQLDLELATAGQAELMRVAVDTFRPLHPAGPTDGVTVSYGDNVHHLLTPITDPHGDRLLLSLIVVGSSSGLCMLRRRLRSMQPHQLNIGPVVHPAGSPPPLEDQPSHRASEADRALSPGSP